MHDGGHCVAWVKGQASLSQVEVSSGLYLRVTGLTGWASILALVLTLAV